MPNEIADYLIFRTWWSYPPGNRSWFESPYHAFNLFEGTVWVFLAGLVLRRFLPKWIDVASFDMFDRPASGRDQEIGDHQAVAIRHPFLGAHQAERLGQLPEAADQKVAGAFD